MEKRIIKPTPESIGALTSKSVSRRSLMKAAGTLAAGTLAGGAIASGTRASESASAATAPTKSAAGDTIIASPTKAVVETTSGKVHGFIRNDIFTFKGMPYAASTEGKNRFMPPAKPTPWTGVRSSMFWGPVSPQTITSTFDGRRAGWNHDEEAFMFEWEDGQPSEDCLRVNVWTPSISDNRKRPVLVWIHGGGFTSGSDNELRMYDGESLSRRGDVVMVSLNHRLGVLGYMNLMDYGEKWSSSPNVGMLDIIAALEWVRDNISNFGGDPGKVLIFGQSGGGSKVGTLMGMPSAKGLFHRAVIESGSTLRQNTPERSAPLAAAVIAELGLTRDTVDKIQDFPNEVIVQAGMRAQQKMAAAAGGRGGPGGGGGGWGPVVDGKVLPAQAWDPGASALSADVPLMVGTVLNEFANSVQMADASLDSMSLDEVQKRLAPQRGEKTAHIIDVFQKAHPSAMPFEIYSRITAMPARQSAITQAERKAALGAAPAYLYWFQWQTPVLDGRPRAYHCSELPFVFYNTDRCAVMTGGGPEPRELAGRIADAWLNFARTGDPNHAGLPKWPAFTKDQVPAMIFDTKCDAANDPDGEPRRALLET